MRYCGICYTIYAILYVIYHILYVCYLYFSGRNPDAESIDGAQTMVVTAMVSSSAEAESAETMLDQERNQTDKI